MAKAGRPTKYTRVLSEEICAELSEGKPLRQICREKSLAWRSVFNWREQFPDFDRRFGVAREMGEEAIAADCLEIADTPLIGLTKTHKDGKVEVKEEDALGHRKLQIDTRLKLLAKWNPKKWGEKLEQIHKGDPNAPVQLILNGSDVHG